jgi:hypothetical protein
MPPMVAFLRKNLFFLLLLSFLSVAPKLLAGEFPREAKARFMPENVYSWMPVRGPYVGSGSGLPAGAVLPDPYQTVGNGLIKIGIDTASPEVVGLTSANQYSGNHADSIRLSVIGADGVEYSLKWADKIKHEVLFYSTTVVHVVLSGMPRSYLGQPANLYVSWHIIVNKGEAGIYTYCEFKYTPSLGIPKPIEISQIGLSLIFEGKPFARAFLSDKESHFLHGQGSVYSQTSLSADKYAGLVAEREERGLWAIIIDETRYDLEGGSLFDVLDKPHTELQINFLRRPPGHPLNILALPKDNPQQQVPKSWRVAFGPLLLYVTNGQGASARQLAKQRRDEEVARAAEGSLEVAGKKGGYELFTGSFIGELQQGIWQGRTVLRNAIIRLTLSNRYLHHSPVRVFESGRNGWARSGSVIPSFEFAYPAEDYTFGYPEDYCFLFLSVGGSILVEEADKGVRLGHIINTSFLLEVENDETSHCWNFTETSTSSGLEGLPQTMAPRVLRSAKHVMGLPYLLWWAGVVYGHGNPTTQVHLANLVSNGPERVQFRMVSWLDDKSFRYETDILIRYPRNYNSIHVSLKAICEIGITAGAALHTFRMPIGTEPSSRTYSKLAYLRSDGKIVERFIGNNDRSWTPWEELRIPGWYALSDSATGRGNIGVLLRSASYTVHISCFDEEPEAYDEVFLADLSVPGKKINKNQEWHLEYEIMIYDDSPDYSPVIRQFEKQ